MDEQQELTSILESALTTLWDKVAGFVPELVAAILVFIIIWIIAIILAKIAWHIVKAVKLDAGLQKIGFADVWGRSGHKLDAPMFFYELVKWFFIIVGLMAAADILGLESIKDMLGQVVSYLPNVFLAAIVLIIGVLVAGFVEKLVRASIKAAQLGSAHALSAIAKWAVLIFAVLIALEQLQVGQDIIRFVEIGILVALALAFGLAFGLGGKSHADDVIKKMRDHIKD